MESWWAFERSSLAVTWPSCRKHRKRLVAWTAASQPPLTPTPTWLGRDAVEWSRKQGYGNDQTRQRVLHIYRPTCATWTPLQSCFVKWTSLHLYQIEYCSKGVHLNIKISKVGSRPTETFLGGGKFYSSFLQSSYVNVKMKELLKLVQLS